MIERDPVNIIRGEVDKVPFADISVPGKGCCELRLEGPIAELRAFFVHADHRRQGIGTDMFIAARGVARMERKLAVTWTVRKDNEAAIAFYRRMGAKRFYQDHQDWWFSFSLEG